MSGTPLTDAITALTTYANTVTGKTPPDTTLSEAVATLASGYGGGGGISADDIAMRKMPTSITLTTATRIYAYAFYNTTDIENFDGGTATEIGTQAFRYSSVKTVVLPNVTTISGSSTYTFGGCTSLTRAMLPKLTTMASVQRIFEGSTALEVCDMGLINGMVNNTFNGCTSLRTLILRKTGSICTTNWWSAAVFGGIYNNPTESTIYVPQALISTYQTATNWSSAYAAGVTFAKIEGSIYE